MSTMYAMGAAVPAAAMPETAAMAAGGAQEASAPDFAQLLRAMGGASQPAGAPRFFDFSGREYKVAVMTEAMGALAKAEKPQAADPVLAGLLQMLKGMNADGEVSEAEMAELEALLEKMKERLLQLAQENGAGAAAQQLLAILPAVAQGLTGQAMPAETLQALSEDGGAAALETVLQSKPEALAGFVLAGAPMQTEPAAQSADAAAILAAGPGEAAQADGPVQGAAQAEATTPAKAGVDFAQAVRAARQQMTQAETKTEAEAAPAEGEELDVDALQKQVDAGLFFKNTAAQPAQAEGLAGAPTAGEAAFPLAGQLTDGILQAAQSGKEELVIKLAPEELGEVTIRLVHTAEGTQVNIIAKHDATQRLLAGEADVLRDSLRPLKVEVDSILTQRQYEMLSGQQNFGGRQQHSFTRMRGAAYYKDEPLGAAQAMPLAMPVMAGAPQSALDAYV